MNPNLSLTDTQYIAWRALANATAIANLPITQAGAYRPKQWNSEDSKELFYISGSQGDYFFDAVLKVEHVNQRRLTMHPVQTGANIADHSYQIPARVTMEIGVSDVMDSYSPDGLPVSLGNGLVNSGGAKSVNAYQTLRKLQDSGEPLTVVTRLNTYENMVIESMTNPEDFKTVYSMKALITFQQIITASVAVRKVSLAPHTAVDTPKGAPQLIQVNNSNSRELLGFSITIPQRII
jgi:hypothetical protein